MSQHPSPLWPSLLPPAQQGSDELCAVSAQGVRVRFANGQELLCGTSGLWNVNIGYGNRAIAEASAQALRDASYLGVFRYENSYARHAARLLVDIAGGQHFSRVLFSTSGGAANEIVMKLARHYHVLGGETRRKVVVGLRGSYHGLTYGSFGLTGEHLGQRLYGVDQRLVRHVTPNDEAEWDALLTRQGDQIAAVVVEPVLGSGAIPLMPCYIEKLLRARSEYGFLLVADEVATGFGRTGTFFASQRWPEPPDVLVASKGLTNGACAAAVVIVAHHVTEAFDSAEAILTHGETQAGTPVAAAAIIATIAEMGRLDAVAAGNRLAVRLDAHLAELQARHPIVAATTGLGCFRSIRLHPTENDQRSPCLPHELIAAVRDAGAIVHPGPAGIQLVPALTYTDDELDELIGAVHSGLDRITGGTSSYATEVLP